MTKLVVVLTFIPWILYFLSSSSRTIKDFRRQKINKQFLKENILKLFRFDNMILIGLYIYFSLTYPDADQIWLIRVLLFASINLYLLLNSIYDKKNKDSLEKKEKNIIFMLAVLILIPLIYYAFTRHYKITYYIMFGYSFFNGIIVLICTMLYKKFKTKKKKHEKHL